jgi:hypothetical protein
MLEGVGLRVPSTANDTTDHADPLIFDLLAMIALQIGRTGVYHVASRADILVGQQQFVGSYAFRQS